VYIYLYIYIYIHTYIHMHACICILDAQREIDIARRDRGGDMNESYNVVMSFITSVISVT